jgi:Icc-related predicted phosphoesterase
MLRIAAVADLHARESPPGAFRDLLNDICEKAHLCLLCGDLTDHGLPSEATALAAEFSGCRIPLVGVLGNHDYEAGQHEEIRRALAEAGVTILDGEACEVGGVGLAGVKGFGGGFDSHMLQPWGEDAVKRFVYEAVNEAMRLEGALAKLRTEQTVVLVHYAPIRQTVEGEPPELLPFLGSSRLAEAIDRFPVAAVVHGHAHYGAPEGRTARGVPVYNVSLPLMRRLHPEQPYRILEV